MEFDEYDYLEKTVENPELSSANGNGALADERRHKSSRRGDGDGEGPSKRPRTDDDRERHRDRGSSRDRKERDRHRSSRERRDDRGGGRERERERERDHDRGGRERDGERPGRGRSHSERRREEEPDRHREKSKEREREREKEKEKEKEREKERERERESRERDRDREGRYTRATFGWSIWLTEEHRNAVVAWRHKEKKEEAAEPEADPERDQRTVFAYQINLKADERDVYEFFSRAGKVRDVRLIMDRNSRRSKGVGYIEFYDAMSVPMAIALTGQKLLGQAVMVKPSEAEKNLVHSSTSGAAAAGAQASGARKLYVGNLHFNITEDQLRQVFEPFGTVELVQMPLDPLTGHCKGFGFVQFARLEDAKAAQSLNGQLEIAGRTIKVSAVTDQIGMQDAGATARDLDDDEGGGLALNAQSRALLMQKLDRSGTATSVNNLTPAAPGLPLPMPSAGVSPVAPMVQTGLSGLVGLPGTAIPAVAAAVPAVDPIGVPSECLLLKNMFDPNTETEPDFDLDIKEDVQDECSKYGPLKHIYVEKNSAGFVYLRFASATSAVTAQRSLHGRWFAGKMITATFIPPHTYEARFPGGDS